MKFNIILKKLSVALVIFCLGMLKTLVADAEINGERPSLIELFYQDSDKVYCDDKGLTVYDKNFITEKFYLTNHQNKCNLAPNVCEVMYYGIVSTEIKTDLIRIAATYDHVISIIKDPLIDQQTQGDIRLYLKNRIHLFLTIRDALENDELFNKVFEAELKNLSEHPSPDMLSFLEDDKNLIAKLAELKNFYPEIPYGANACNKDSSTSDEKTVTECFITQDGFVKSVKMDRENEMNAWDKLGKKNPITHLIRQESIKPCGTVTGAWAANAHGQIVFNTLKVNTPEGKKVSFEKTLLNNLVRKIDQDLRDQRKQQRQ